MPPAAPLSLLRSTAEGAARVLWRDVLWRRRGGAAAGQQQQQQQQQGTAATASHGDEAAAFDVIVIGGGIHGSATTCELAARGLRVACVEQFDFLHRRGSSHGESRVIRRTYPQSHLTQAMTRSYELWDAAQKDFGAAVFTRTGGLDFGRTDFAPLQRLIAANVAHGVPHEVLSREEAARRFPAFRLPPGYHAVWQADAGVLNASKACAMFQELSRRKGAHLLDRTRVLAVTPDAGGVRVETSRGTLKAGKVVLAAGAWAGKLLAGLGVDVAHALKALPVGVSYWRAKDAASAATLSSDVCPVAIHYNETECYLIPMLELPGLVKVSLHLPQVRRAACALATSGAPHVVTSLHLFAVRSICGALRWATRMCAAWRRQTPSCVSTSRRSSTRTCRASTAARRRSSSPACACAKSLLHCLSHTL
jgi:monomeric sarcosine oxidase